MFDSKEKINTSRFFFPILHHEEFPAKPQYPTSISRPTPLPPPHFASAPLLFLAKIFRTLPTQKIKNKIKINQSILEKSYRPLYERGGEAVQTMFKYLKGG